MVPQYLEKEKNLQNSPKSSTGGEQKSQLLNLEWALEQETNMSVIAAADEDVQAGKHTRLSDLLYLCALPDDVVSSDEKKTLRKELMEGIEKYSEFLVPDF